MSSSVNRPGEPAGSFLRRRLLFAALFGLPVVLGLAWLGLLAWGVGRVPEVGGAVHLTAPAGARVYVGDRLSAMPALLAWDALLGDPAAVTADPSAEDLAGPGGQLLRRQLVSKVGSAHVRAAGEECWLRRADGRLDQVFLLTLDWVPEGQAPRVFALPLRVRRGAGADGCYAPGTFGMQSTGRGPAFVKLLGHSPEEYHVNWEFVPGRPPPAFAEEVAAKGLWEPAGP
jgi:hypothetical protein